MKPTTKPNDPAVNHHCHGEFSCHVAVSMARDRTAENPLLKICLVSSSMSLVVRMKESPGTRFVLTTIGYVMIHLICKQYTYVDVYMYV